MNPASTYRLCKHADYQWAYRAARKQYTKNIGYFFAVRPPADAPNARRSATSGARVGLTVPKALGKAHDRNRIKRRLRAAVRANLALLAPSGEGLAIDLILHPRRATLTLDWPALEREVGAIFRTVARTAITRPRPVPPAASASAAAPAPAAISVSASATAASAPLPSPAPSAHTRS